MKCCRLGASSVYTIQPCTSLQCRFIQNRIGRVYVCLGVTCHLHFWQNDRDLLRATAVFAVSLTRRRRNVKSLASCAIINMTPKNPSPGVQSAQTWWRTRRSASGWPDVCPSLQTSFRNRFQPAWNRRCVPWRAAVRRWWRRCARCWDWPTRSRWWRWTGGGRMRTD